MFTQYGVYWVLNRPQKSGWNWVLKIEYSISPNSELKLSAQFVHFLIECSWQIPYSIRGIKIELLSTQSLLRIWTYWVLNDSIEKMQLLSTQFQLRIWTYWVLNLEYSISTTFLWAIEYSINPILSEHYALYNQALKYSFK